MFCRLAYFAALFALSRRFLPAPAGTDGVVWAQRVVSTAHATAATVDSIHALRSILSSRTVLHELTRERNDAGMRLKVDLGYFVFDTAVDVWKWVRARRVNVPDLLHHALALYIIIGYSVSGALGDGWTAVERMWTTIAAVWA